MILPRKKLTLKKELMRLMLITSICTLLTVMVAVFYILISFFFEKTREDIEYVLSSTTSRYQSHMQFIEDGQISIRRNVMLDDFFDGNNYSEETATAQLSYCMNLYSERNIVDRQEPFVTRVYLFNNRGSCISQSYYASTLAIQMQAQSQFETMHEWFSSQGTLYSSSSDDDSIYYYFRLYDDDMSEKGICIAQVSRAALESVLSEITSYANSFWSISAGDSLAYEGREEYLTALEQDDFSWDARSEIDSTSMIGSVTTGAYGTKLILAISTENIFSIMQPTFIVLVLELLVVFAIAILVSYGASSRFLKPVSKMMETIQDFGRQNFAVRVADSDIQEFQDIGNVFNEMADNIEHLITDVYEKQLLATRSQVKYLQAQINPHFQFNILSMLSLKAKVAGNEEIYEGLHAFARLTQGKIFREGEIKIRVAEELEIVSFYLYLQKSRFGEKLTYEINLQKEEIGDYMIPRLLIEPIVENAVSHGIEPKRSKGHVKVELCDRDSNLCIVVEDDGVGADRLGDAKADRASIDRASADRIGTNRIDTEKAVTDRASADRTEAGYASKGESTQFSSHTHTSLENTRRMLQILYGEHFSMDFVSEKDIGTRVEILIPIERG